jgi:hypothetical protein
MSAMSIICNVVGECLHNLWSWMCESWCGRDTFLPLDDGGDVRDPEEEDITMSQFLWEVEQTPPPPISPLPPSPPPPLSSSLIFYISSSSSSSSLPSSYYSSSSGLTAVSEEINDGGRYVLDDAVEGVDAAKEGTVGPSDFSV